MYVAYIFRHVWVFFSQVSVSFSLQVILMSDMTTWHHTENCVIISWDETERWLYQATQQDCYGWQSCTLLHSVCTSTYTEVTVLLLWSSSNATLEYPCRYSNRVAVWVLHGNSRITSQEQHSYFSVATSAVTV